MNCLYQSDTPEKVTGDNYGLYLQSKHSQAPNQQIIPTFLDLTRGAKKEQALQRIFQNIINNTDIIDILAEIALLLFQEVFQARCLRHKLHLVGKRVLLIK